MGLHVNSHLLHEACQMRLGKAHLWGWHHGIRTHGTAVYLGQNGRLRFSHRAHDLSGLRLTYEFTGTVAALLRLAQAQASQVPALEGEVDTKSTPNQ